MNEPSLASGSGLDILSDLPPRRRSNQTCDVNELRIARPDLAEQYDRALAANRFSDGAIAAWITDHGHPLARLTVQRHRKGECQRCRLTR